MRHDELRVTVAIKVGNGNSTGLALGAKPTRHLDGFAPAATNLSCRVQPPAHANISVITARRMIDMESHQLRDPIAVKVGNGEATALVLIAKPTGDFDRCTPATGD